jgi:hypothetical protein
LKHQETTAFPVKERLDKLLVEKGIGDLGTSKIKGII